MVATVIIAAIKKPIICILILIAAHRGHHGVRPPFIAGYLFLYGFSSAA
jgi:hypothetical protein